MEGKPFGPTTEDANEFATFELGRLGYDVQSSIEVSVSTEDADDLLLLVLGDDLSPEVVAGLVWAVTNRPVNWQVHLHPNTYNPKERAILEAIRAAAGL